MKLKRRDVSKMITAFKNERKNVAEKIKKADANDKKALTEYDKYLEDGIKKLEEYEESLLSPYELTVKDTDGNYDRDEQLKDIEFDDDDVDFDYNFESTNFENLFDKSNNFSQRYFTECIKANISNMDNDIISVVTDLACNYPSIINTNTLYNILKEEMDASGNREYNWLKKSTLLSNMRKVNPEENYGYKVKQSSEYGVFEAMETLDELFTEYTINKSLQYTNESASSTVKLLANKLRKIMQKAQDTDKELSRKIDSSVNMFISGIQRAATNDNREAIIRGSIIPSASKVVKTAIIDGGVALLNPAVAIILALGQFATRKSMMKKERQLVLDEIDIELEMCKRYLRQAEDNNDLAAQKQILQIQRNLERQKSRIEYKMKIYWNQNVPSVNKEDD